jgi:hypothetical protein
MKLQQVANGERLGNLDYNGYDLVLRVASALMNTKQSEYPQGDDSAIVALMSAIETLYPELYNKAYNGWLRAFHNGNRLLLHANWNEEIKWYQELLRSDASWYNIKC